MKANDIFQAQQALAAIGRTRTGSINQSLAVARAIAPALAELELATSKIRERHQELLDQYAAKDEDGKLKVDEAQGRYVFENGQQERFEEKYAALMAEDVELAATVDLEPLEGLDAVSDLTPLELLAVLRLAGEPSQN